MTPGDTRRLTQRRKQVGSGNTEWREGEFSERPASYQMPSYEQVTPKSITLKLISRR